MMNWHNDWPWRLRTGAAVGLWFCFVYISSDWLTGLRAEEKALPSLLISADGLIPFWPQSAWIYITITPAMFLLVLAVRERSELKALAWTVAAEIAVAGLVYLVLPVAASRTPETNLPVMMRFADNLNLTYNSFPSLHVALSVTTALAMFSPAHGKRNLILALWAAAVCASSLLTHQHTIADVAGGLVLAGLGSFLFRYLILRQTKPGLAH